MKAVTQLFTLILISLVNYQLLAASGLSGKTRCGSVMVELIIIIIIILFIERHIQRAVRGAVQHSKAGVKRNH